MNEGVALISKHKILTEKGFNFTQRHGDKDSTQRGAIYAVIEVTLTVTLIILTLILILILTLTPD